MDKLEDYIRKNREELDEYSPSSEIWNRINRDLHKKRYELIRWFSAAAIIVFVFTSSVLFYIAENRKNYLDDKNESDSSTETPDLRIKETEIYYNNLINDLYGQATPFLTGHPDVERELINDLAQLDSICSEIKSDLNDNIDNKEVIEALIINYRIKIRILENVLNTLDCTTKTKELPDSYEL
jgi:hypothetical protein